MLASLPLRAAAFARRAAEYHFALLASLLGMLVLASARELILLFVAFELMSIPLYFLTGFLKRERGGGGGGAEVLPGRHASRPRCSSTACRSSTASTGTTDAARRSRARSATGHPLMLLGLVLALGGLGFKIAAFPFHMWVPDTYEAASTPFVAWLSVAPKAAGFVVIFRLYLEGVGDRRWLWVPAGGGARHA